MNEEAKQKIINLILKDKVPLEEIAKKLYISVYQLKILLKEWGVELPKKRRYKVVETPAREELMKLYNELGNAKKVSEHYAVGINTVMRWMKKLKIPSKKLVGMTDEEKAKYLEEHIGKLNLENL